MPILFFGGATTTTTTGTRTVTARNLVTQALKLIGVLAAGETATAGDLADGFVILNDLVDGWGTERLTMPTTARQLFTLTTAATYTLGTDGTFDHQWPNWIDRAGSVVTTSGVAYEYKVSVLTADQWGAIPLKAQTGPWPTALYYDHAYSSEGLGTISVWPVPDGTHSVQLALYLPSAIAQFATLDTTYALAPGYTKTLRYSLAAEMAPAFGVQADPMVLELARIGKADLKRANIRLYDLSVSHAVGTRRSGYNIASDT